MRKELELLTRAASCKRKTGTGDTLAYNNPHFRS